VKQNAETNRK